jgi:lipoprotein-releasing system ATP-binding protein
MSDAIIRCTHLHKSYHDGNASVQVLNDLSFAIDKGASVAIIGPSGSGKSTLLHILGGLDSATSGQVLIQGQDWQSLTEKKRCQLRNQQLGFVYQFHHLLPEFTALENVAMPLLLAGQSVAAAKEAAHVMLGQVGLNARERHKPSQLSGGERQRVAIARALVHQPACVFADEPTGNLDQATAASVFDLMLELKASLKMAQVIVTHDKQLAARMDRVLMLQDGRLF